MPITELRPAAPQKPAFRLPRGAVPAALFLTLAVLCLCTAAGLTGTLFFPLLSLWAGCLLICLVLAAVRRAGVRFELFHGSILVEVYLVLAIGLNLQVQSRDFVYVWDYSNYTLLQYAAEDAFAAGPLAGLGHLLSSLTDDYTSFICLFTEFPFFLSAHTGDSFVLSQLVSVLPALLLALGGVVVKAGQMLDVQNQHGFFLMGLSFAACFPFLRMAAALGQPDWFGLIFAFIILLLTLDYRFDTAEPARWAGLFFATAALTVTRRWYLYFIVGYYAVYAVTVVAGAVRLGRSGHGRAAGDRIRWLVTFGAGSVAAMIVLFRPIVVKVLTYSYAAHYAAYNTGGLGLELYSQMFRLGPLYLPLAIAGVVWACRHGRIPLAAQTLAALAVSLVLFTRVQNMGSHQTLLLVPGYTLLMLLGAAALAESLASFRKLKIGYWLFTLAFSMTVRLSPLTTIALPEFLFPFLDTGATAEFVRLDTMVYDRTDLPQIQALARWIDRHCAEGEFAYMIPHSMTYCPDTFKNASLPDRPLDDKLAFGFGILGTQPFPTELFEAKYVLTADPFPWCYEVSGVAAKLNDQFFTISGGYYVPEQSFDMGNRHPGRGRGLPGRLRRGGRPVPRAVQPGHPGVADRTGAVNSGQALALPGPMVYTDWMYPAFTQVLIYRRFKPMMKLYGAPICSTCREVKQVLDEKGIPYEYVDITESTKNLRAFLAMRDTLPVYDEAKAEGRIGIPSFVWEDGSVTLDTGWLSAGGACTDC